MSASPTEGTDMNQIEKALSDYLGDMCGMRLKPHALTGLAEAAAVIRDYGDERYQAAIADVVEWLRVQQHGRTSDNYPGYYARQIEQRFGKDA